MCEGDVEFCKGNKQELGFKIIIKCKFCASKEKLKVKFQTCVSQNHFFQPG